MRYASAGSSAASSGADPAGASVTKLEGPQPSSRSCARNSASLIRPLSRPSAASKTSSAADLHGVALDRLDGIALGVGVAALVLQRAQDLRQLGEAEGILDGHR